MFNIEAVVLFSCKSISSHVLEQLVKNSVLCLALKSHRVSFSRFEFIRTNDSCRCKQIDKALLSPELFKLVGSEDFVIQYITERIIINSITFVGRMLF